jgi:hypothetical protein
MRSEPKTILNRSASIHVVIKYLKRKLLEKGVGAGESPTNHQCLVTTCTLLSSSVIPFIHCHI